MLLHQMYGCNLAMEKSDEHTKLVLGSLIQKFICYYTFQIVVREKEIENKN